MSKQTEGNQLELDIQTEGTSQQKGSVECLGITFESDEARRAYFLDEVARKAERSRVSPD